MEGLKLGVLKGFTTGDALAIAALGLMVVVVGQLAASTVTGTIEKYGNKAKSLVTGGDKPAAASGAAPSDLPQ